jgi:hypothetical protein
MSAGVAGSGAVGQRRAVCPYAVVGEPDPDQAGEFVVGEGMCLGAGAEHRPVPLAGAGPEPVHGLRQPGRFDGLVDAVRENGH